MSAGKPDFEPKDLPRESLDVPIEGHWRSVAPEDAKQFHERALAEHRRFAPFGPRVRRRLLRLVATCGLGFLGLAWLFTATVSLKALLFGAAVGALLTWLRPRKDFYATLFMLSGLASVAWESGGVPWPFRCGLILALFAVFGMLMSMGEESRRLDGLD